VLLVSVVVEGVLLGELRLEVVPGMRRMPIALRDRRAELPQKRRQTVSKFAHLRILQAVERLADLCLAPSELCERVLDGVTQCHDGMASGKFHDGCASRDGKGGYAP